jgi:hypothetical protein
MYMQLLEILNGQVSAKLYLVIIAAVSTALITGLTTTIVDHLVLKPEVRVIHAACLPTPAQIQARKKYFRGPVEEPPKVFVLS